MQPNIKKDSSRRLLKKRTIPIGPSFMKDSPQKINFKANEELLINLEGSPIKLQMATPVNLGGP
jgi:hypothetical protein